MGAKAQLRSKEAKEEHSRLQGRRECSHTTGCKKWREVEVKNAKNEGDNENVKFTRNKRALDTAGYPRDHEQLREKINWGRINEICLSHYQY